ncbi:MAG: hypothetical protein EAZ83_03875 [Oscillatoriales cyanobacterium]|nr:MAG: hypothetical protein EAZ83_03875 [Oscillatoriales cyanobacterium]
MDKGFLPARPRSKLLKKPSPISMQELQGSLSSYFDDIPDPRVNRTKRHLLKDIAFRALIGGMTGNRE